MALLCDIATIKAEGRRVKKIWCDELGAPCAHVRFCAVSNKYYQTDAAAKCKVRENHGKNK